MKNIYRSMVPLAILFCMAISSTASAKSPNIVLIISDDQAWNDYSFIGHKTIETPHLDKLAKQSVVFTRGYVPTSLCRPSLMTLATGLYPHQNKISGNDPPRDAAGKLTDRNLMLKHIRRLPTLPKMLAKQGYLSMQTGKWWEGNYKEGGFTHGMTHGDVSRGGRHGDEGLKISRKGMKPIIDFIDECGDRPFFLWHAPFLPHSPHNPPERLLKKYRSQVDSIHVARYYAMCDWFDETCGELLDHLDKKGLSDNTLVLYVTDNGWIQSTDSRRYAPRSKRSPYDGGIRTPIMLRWPGKLKPQYDEQTLVNSIDLVPTILAACGLEPTEAMQGLNLLDMIDQKGPSRNTIYGEVFEHDEADIDDPAKSLLYRWCIEKNWKIIVPNQGSAVELFDLAKDPFERNNLAKENADRVKHLTSKLDAWWNPQGQ